MPCSWRSGVISTQMLSHSKWHKDFKGSLILEIVENFDGDTYRTVYTVKFKHAVYVLHAFQKKSKKGIETSKQDIDLIRSRLKDAKSHYEARKWSD